MKAKRDSAFNCFVALEARKRRGFGGLQCVDRGSAVSVAVDDDIPTF